MKPQTKKPQISAQMIQQFQEITDCPDKILAAKILNDNGGNVNNAVEAFYSGNHNKKADSKKTGSMIPAVDSKMLEQEFQRFQDGDNKLREEGICKLFEELGVGMDDIFVYLFSFEAKAEVMGEFKKEEFIRAMTSNGCSTVKELRDRAPKLRQRYAVGTQEFNDLYKFVFQFSIQGSCKMLTVVEASMILTTLVGDGYPQARRFCSFLANDLSVQKEGVFKDTWNMILCFLKKVGGKGEHYTTDDAWPLLVVNYMESIAK